MISAAFASRLLRVEINRWFLAMPSRVLARPAECEYDPPRPDAECGYRQLDLDCPEDM